MRAAVALTRRGLDLLGQHERGIDRAFDAGMTGVSTGDPKNARRANGALEPSALDVLIILGAVRDIRTRVSGAYLFVPSVSALRWL